MKKAFATGRKAVSQQRLLAALESKSERGVETAMSPGITAFAKAVAGPYREVMASIVAESGTKSAKKLKSGGVKASAKGDTKVGGIDFAFDRTNPSVVDWINEHTLETVDDLSQTARDTVRDILSRAFDEQFDPKDMADELTAAIGDEVRADLIARTESMIAANEGQAEAWDQAVEAGLLSGDEKKVWIVTPDDHLCPICEAIEDQVVGLDENFESPETGEQFDQPPAHPRCRCTTGLVAGE